MRFLTYIVALAILVLALGPANEGAHARAGPIPTPDHVVFRCRPCVDKAGPFTPQPGIKPEHSCGIVKEIGHVEE